MRSDRVISNLKLAAIIKLIAMIMIIGALIAFGIAVADWRIAIIASLISGITAMASGVALIVYVIFLRSVFRELNEQSPEFSLPLMGSLIYLVSIGILIISIIFSVISNIFHNVIAGLISMILGILGGITALISYIFVDVIGYLKLSDYYSVDSFRTVAILNIFFPFISPFFILQGLNRISVTPIRQKRIYEERVRRAREVELELYVRPQVVEETYGKERIPSVEVTETVPRGALILPDGKCIEVFHRVEIGRDLLTNLNVRSDMVRYISRRHFAVFYQNNEWYVEDLGSRNGTYLNGKLLQPHVPHRLRDGDIISPAKVFDIRFSTFSERGCIRV